MTIHLPGYLLSEDALIAIAVAANGVIADLQGETECPDLHALIQEIGNELQRRGDIPTR